MKNERQIRKVANEAARIMRDYPHLKYYQAIMKAKEVLKDDMGGKNGEKETKVH